jgi:PPM family protein phosphatase
MVIRYGSRTDKGRVRQDNQDAYGVIPADPESVKTPKGMLFVVADGMGGHRAGGRASELAVSTVTSTYSTASAGAVPDLLRLALDEANARVYGASVEDVRLRGMGTTCTILVLQESTCWLGHVGDSKVFLVSPEEVRQLTTDHSRVWDLFRKGVITREQARVHPERNLLTRALGTQPDVVPEFLGPLPVTPGAWLVMCTDGLTNHVEEAEMREIVTGEPPQNASDELVALANRRGGTDNVTVITIQLL